MPSDRQELIDLYGEVRALTERLAAPLSAEDQLLQSMPSCSPTKWHRAHTSWFFEAFVLRRLGLPPVDARSDYLWNSYYEAVGARHPRPQRGLLSRPSLDEVAAYRRAVDGRVLEALSTLDDAALDEVLPIVRLGLAHEQQHQELILTDILHALSLSPLRPAYRAPPTPGDTTTRASAPPRFVPCDGGLVEIGVDADARAFTRAASSVGPRAADAAAVAGRSGGLLATFSFDNEGPRHRVWLEPFALATRLVTVGEVRAFIAAGGYTTPSLWLSEGWDWVRREGVTAPLHARVEGGAYRVFTLEGERDAADDEPASHLSYFEADALARFLGARLPSEHEWEHAVRALPVRGHLLDLDRPLRPLPVEVAAPDTTATGGPALAQAFGDTWEWTRSAYAPYPGYTPTAGALGEYNGKFMVSQLVLRGGSCLTPPGHVRATYRNFWHPDTRFQMTGVRLARDA